MQWTGTRTELPMGLYVLAADGTLCAVGMQNALLPDKSLSGTLAEELGNLLRAYQTNPETPGLRVAVLYESTEARPWGKLTLTYEDQALRDLYPVSQHGEAGLTAFQQKNREKSLFRGMELLLEQRRDSAKNVPVYCPLLFDSGLTLGKRAAAFGRTPTAAEAALRSVDVLNLIAAQPNGIRESSGVNVLIEHLRASLIRKDARRDPQFSMFGERPMLTPGNTSGGISMGGTPPKAAAPNAVSHVSLLDVDQRRLHETERVDSIEHWCKQPVQTVNPPRLNQFRPFAAVGEKHLVDVAARCPLYMAPPGARLMDRGLNDAWNLFLIEGSLLLTPEDGNAIRIDAGTDRAANAVASLKPRKYQVDTLSAVTFLWVHDLLIRACSSI
ncbi:MAG: hypothetical protein OEV31_05605 [Gammaproteobacteria bacterium]|nr:hypothetical protein [Gammaproteobacteria bacterium]